MVKKLATKCDIANALDYEIADRKLIDDFNYVLHKTHFSHDCIQNFNAKMLN